MRNLKRYCCFLLLIFTNGFANGQIFPLPSPGAKWNVLINNFGLNQCTIKYEYQKDTFMCGYNYALISNQNQGCSWWSPIMIRHVGNLVYGRLYDCSNTEYLLYNFNLNVGDTFIANVNLNDTAVVTSVALVQLPDGSIRKHFILHSIGLLPMPYYWIEGIGDLTNLYYMYNFPDPVLNLLCFEDSTGLVYKNSFWNTCDTTIIAGMDQHDNNVPLFTIYPNPFTTETLITFSETQRSAIITITDLLGRQVRKTNFSGMKWKLERESLKSGIYLVQVNDGNHYYASKLIIQ